jgi:hypothetical protein
MDMSDHTDQLRYGPGHPVKLPNFAESAPKSLKKLLRSESSFGKYNNSIAAMVDGKADDA